MNAVNTDFTPTGQPQDTESAETTTDVINDLGLSPEAQAKLAEMHASEGDSAEFMTLLSELEALDTGTASALVSGADSNTSLESLQLVAAELASNPSLADTMERVGPEGISGLLAAAELGEGGLQTATNVLDTIGDDDAAATTFLQNTSSLTKAINGEASSALMEQYAAGVSPDVAMQRLATDTLNLDRLNNDAPAGFNFKLSDMPALGLSAVTGSDAEARVQGALDALAGLDGSTTFTDTADILAAVDAYTAAGGTDIAGFVGQLDKMEDGIREAKAALGLPQDGVLLGPYEQQLLTTMAQSAADNNLDVQPAIDAEIANMESASGGPTPMTADQAYNYESGGFSEPTSNHPMPAPERLPDDRRGTPSTRTDEADLSGPFPGSAANTGSVTEAIVFPSLADRGYDDISESPLFDEEILKNYFTEDGEPDLEAYGKYLAQQHSVLEVMGYNLDADAGGAALELEGGITLEDVKAYFFSMDMTGERMMLEIGFIQHATGKLDDIAQAGGSSTVGDEGFDEDAYIRSGGDLYQFEQFGDMRPLDRYGTGGIIPSSVTDQMFAARRVHSDVLTTSIATQRYANAENNALNEYTTALDEIANGQEPNEEVNVGYGEGEAGARANAAYEKYQRYGAISEEIERNSRNFQADSTGETGESMDQTYYNGADGSLKMAEYSDGSPVLNAEGQPMSLVEYDAIMKFANKDMLDELIPQHSVDGDGNPRSGGDVLTQYLGGPGANGVEMPVEQAKKFRDEARGSADGSLDNPLAGNPGKIQVSALFQSGFAAEAERVANNLSETNSVVENAQAKFEKIVEQNQAWADIYFDLETQDIDMMMSIINLYR